MSLNVTVAVSSIIKLLIHLLSRTWFVTILDVKLPDRGSDLSIRNTLTAIETTTR